MRKSLAVWDVNGAYSRSNDTWDVKMIDDVTPPEPVWRNDNAFGLTLSAALLQGYGQLHCETIGGTYVPTYIFKSIAKCISNAILLVVLTLPRLKHILTCIIIAST